MSGIDEAVGLLQPCRRIVVFTGSGASVASGIPTFEQGGLTDWGEDHWTASEEWRTEVWAMIFDTYADAKPNAGHEAIVRLMEAGRATHISSNVDELIPAISVCGTARLYLCPECDEGGATEALRSLWESGGPMLCKLCDGTLRPRVTFVGEPFTWELFSASTAMRQADALVLVGASDLVGSWEPALNLALERGLHVVVVNPDPPPRQVESADVVVRQPAEEALPLIVEGLLEGGDQ